jgi:hypothetical protein
VRLTIDGEELDVQERPDEPGAYDFAWLSGPNPDYGFSVRRSDRAALSRSELEAEARGFLAQIDPGTGYLG